MITCIRPLRKRHIRARIEADVVVGMIRHLGPTRIGHDERRAALGRLLHERRRHRVVVGGVGADDENGLGLQTIGERIGHRTAANLLHQGRYGGGMTQPRAVIDVIGAEHRADQLLKEIIVFVRALGRAESGQGLDRQIAA